MVVEGERRRWWGVCCGGLVVGRRRLRMGVRRCLRGGVVEVKVVAVWCSCLGALLVVAIWLLGGDWSKIMIEKRKMANSKRRSPVTRRIPSEQRWGNLTTHILIDISNLRTFMV